MKLFLGIYFQNSQRLLWVTNSIINFDLQTLYIIDFKQSIQAKEVGYNPKNSLHILCLLLKTIDLLIWSQRYRERGRDRERKDNETGEDFPHPGSLPDDKPGLGQAKARSHSFIKVSYLGGKGLTTWAILQHCFFQMSTRELDQKCLNQASITHYAIILMLRIPFLSSCTAVSCTLRIFVVAMRFHSEHTCRIYSAPTEICG